MTALHVDKLGLDIDTRTRVIRNQRKGVQGRHLNTLSLLIVEEDVNGANVRLASMKITFEEL